MNQLLHTPEGVRDIYEAECEAKIMMEEKMTRALRGFGYRRIITPSFEFFDIFGKEIGTTASQDLYKFFDREGNTLVLRPDVTPSIARACATYFTDRDLPIRLFYNENVFINHHTLRGRLKEHTQIGAELIGDASIDADAEILAAGCQTLLAAGLTDFTISIGHNGFFAGLVEECGLEKSEADLVRELMINKNIFGLEEILKNHHVAKDLRELYSSIGRLFGEPKEWTGLYELAKPYPKIYDTLCYCEQLYDILRLYGVDEHISFELGLLNRYSYYTGIIFSGYTYGSGEAVLSGGRYDRLLSYFGKDTPATGFAITCDALLFALQKDRQPASSEAEDVLCIFYHGKDRADGIQMANVFRSEGKCVRLCLLPEDENEANKILAAHDDYILIAPDA
ncbi:MAG: ATP phosphoribosyltransferase regulatory subunit [Lachnospiraceae bacterium]|nr:ATP phosphoribosyltransferase regulatory subunit [Lachnospiraceae bacterium]